MTLSICTTLSINVSFGNHAPLLRHTNNLFCKHDRKSGKRISAGNPEGANQALPQFFYSLQQNCLPLRKVMCDLLACKNKTILLPYPVDLQKFKRMKKLGDDFRKKYGIARVCCHVCCIYTGKKRAFLILLKQQNPCLITNLFGLAKSHQAHTLKYRRRIQKIVKNPPKNVLFVGRC